MANRNRNKVATFKRVESARTNKKDTIGNVRIAVMRCENNKHLPGNIMRQITLKDTKVSVVFNAIMEALDIK